jgi:tetratricopeptide (TPR) repeat protein
MKTQRPSDQAVQRGMPTFVCIVALCLALTFARNSSYHTTLTLWQEVVERNPNRARAHNNLGNAYLNLGMTAEAIEEYQRTLALDRYYVKTYYNLGTALEDAGRPDEAASSYAFYCKNSPPDFRRPIACERAQVLSRAGKNIGANRH